MFLKIVTFSFKRESSHTTPSSTLCIIYIIWIRMCHLTKHLVSRVISYCDTQSCPLPALGSTQYIHWVEVCTNNSRLQEVFLIVTSMVRLMLCDSHYWFISFFVELRAGEFSPITTGNLVQGNRTYSVLNLRITSDFREKGAFETIQKTEFWYVWVA